MPIRLFLLLASLAIPGAGAEGPKPPAGPDDSEFGILALPFGFYTPETRVGGGGAALLHFRIPGWNAELASTVQVVGIYTQNEQAIAEFVPEVYFAGGDRILKIDARGQYYPDAFYGIGTGAQVTEREVYTARTLRMRTTGLQAVLDHGYAGAVVEIEGTDILSPTPGGVLSRGEAPGAHGGRFVGAGPVFRFDSRNSIFLPTSGAYVEASALAFVPGLGSTMTFRKIGLDLRGFTSPFPGHVLGAHVEFEAADGDVPFQLLPLFGGGRDLRGYLKGRFRDRVLAAAQAEWRLPVFGPVGAAVFGGLGTVAPRVELQNLRALPSVGAGARMVFGEREPISARFDVAYGADGLAVYALAGEAF